MLKKNLFDLNILIFSFLTVFIKWFISYSIFQEENLINKILFDIEDIYYFPFIINLLDLNFSPEYLNNDIRSNNLIPIPIYSILFHTVFFKIFGISSFLFLEFVFLYLFLLLNVKIFVKCDFDYHLAFFISCLIFILPSLLGNLEFFEINLNNTNSLFSFRFPRPLVTSCYFFWGIYLALIYFKEKEFSFKNFIYTSICFSLILVSYYYNFINLFLLFIFIFFIKMFGEKNYIQRNYSKILISILIFLVLIFPFLWIYNISENDFSSMIGVISLNFELKKNLIFYFLSKIFSFKFIFIFTVITFLRSFLLKSKNNYNNSSINFFYYLYIATIISPFFFTLMSPSISEIYHFLNWIVIISILLMIIYSFFFIKFFLEKFLSHYFKVILTTLSFLLIIIFQFFNYENFNKNNDLVQRNDFQNLQNLINLNSNKLQSILTFSIRPQVLWLFNNKKKFNSIESSISSLNFEQLEFNFIENLKFLNVSSNDFLKIISNKKGSWRYDNEYLKYISWYKYQANSLITYKNTKDFENDEIEFIKNSSPTKTQQIILPKFEINRLTVLFENFVLDSNYNKPDIIVLNKQSLINQFSIVDKESYCELKNYKTLKIYVLKKLNLCD